MKRRLIFTFTFTIYIYVTIQIYGETTVDFRLFTSSYAYNGENTYWEATRTTLTYFENFTEGAFDIEFNDLVSLRV